MDNFEVAKKLLAVLNAKFPEIKEVTVPFLDQAILNHYIIDKHVSAFEFFLGDQDRYFCFAMEQGREIFFTRPKEGVMTHLARSLRPKDFMFILNSPEGSRDNLVTKFMETAINRVAQSYIENSLLDQSYIDGKLMFDFTYGFKVTSVNHGNGDYSADVEFTIKKKNGGNWLCFLAAIKNGQWAYIYNQDTKKEFNDIKQAFDFVNSFTK